jgi:hypothetical protein
LFAAITCTGTPVATVWPSTVTSPRPKATRSALIGGSFELPMPLLPWWSR